MELLSVTHDWIASGDPLVNPLADFLITPRDTAKAKLYPLGELTGLFEPRDVLETVGDAERLELLLRYQQSVDLHRVTPCSGSIAMLARYRRRARADIAQRERMRDGDMAEHGGTFCAMRQCKVKAAGLKRRLWGLSHATSFLSRARTSLRRWRAIIRQTLASLE